MPRCFIIQIFLLLHYYNVMRFIVFFYNGWSTDLWVLKASLEMITSYIQMKELGSLSLYFLTKSGLNF